MNEIKVEELSEKIRTLRLELRGSLSLAQDAVLLEAILAIAALSAKEAKDEHHE